MKGLSKLRKLEIDFFTKLTDKGMPVIGELKELRSLYLRAGPGITSAGLAHVWKLRNVRCLSLAPLRKAADGSANSVLMQLSTLPDLEELSLGGPLTDEELKQLAELKKLRRLNLQHNSGYTDQGLAALMMALPQLDSVKFAYYPLVR